MLYSEHLKQSRGCPFCQLSPLNPIIKETPLAFITTSLAPYHKHHIMVLPKRHIEGIFDATEKETQEMLSLIKAGGEIMTKLGYENYAILVREGKVGHVGKSLAHVHYHIVPNTAFTIENYQTRAVMTQDELDAVVKELKNLN